MISQSTCQTYLSLSPSLCSCIASLFIASFVPAIFCLQDIIHKLHTNPLKIFGLPEQHDTYIEVDFDTVWKIPNAMPQSKCGWTPFRNMTVRGSVRKVVIRGEMAFIDGKVIAVCDILCAL